MRRSVFNWFKVSIVATLLFDYEYAIEYEYDFGISSQICTQFVIFWLAIEHRDVRDKITVTGVNPRRMKSVWKLVLVVV